MPYPGGEDTQAAADWGAKLLEEKRKAAAGACEPTPESEGASPFETPIPP